MTIKGKDYIEYCLKEAGIKYEKEYKFLKDRKFRFDFYFESSCYYGNVSKGVTYKVGVEYDGLFSLKSRHTTATGFTKDCEKLNLAQLNGYIVLRYTALNYKDFYKDLQKLL